MQILSVDKEKLSWTIPSFPVLSLDFKHAEIMSNGKILKGLLKFNSVLVGDYAIEINCLSTYQIEIEEEEYFVIWDFSSVIEPGGLLDQDFSDTESESEQDIENSNEQDSSENGETTHCLPFKVMGVTA